MVKKIIILAIILFTIISYEYTNYLIRSNKPDKEGIPKYSRECLINNKKEVTIKTSIRRKNHSRYEIKLIFSQPMKRSLSFFCSQKVIKHFWQGKSQFYLIIKTPENTDKTNKIGLVINHPHSEGFFITKCNKKLPQQVIHIKI